MELLIKLTGYLLILLSLFHIGFPKYFNWKESLLKLELVQRQIYKVHTFFIALTVFLMGLLAATCSTELVTTPLGRKLSVGMGVFWLFRLVIQFFGYSSSLWKRKIFETIVHILFTLLWLFLSIIFLKNGLQDFLIGYFKMAT